MVTKIMLIFEKCKNFGVIFDFLCKTAFFRAQAACFFRPVLSAFF